MNALIEKLVRARDLSSALLEWPFGITLQFRLFELQHDNYGLLESLEKFDKCYSEWRQATDDYEVLNALALTGLDLFNSVNTIAWEVCIESFEAVWLPIHNAAIDCIVFSDTNSVAELWSRTATIIEQEKILALAKRLRLQIQQASDKITQDQLKRVPVEFNAAIVKAQLTNSTPNSKIGRRGNSNAGRKPFAEPSEAKICASFLEGARQQIGKERLSDQELGQYALNCLEHVFKLIKF